MRLSQETRLRELSEFFPAAIKGHLHLSEPQLSRPRKFTLLIEGINYKTSWERVVCEGNRISMARRCRFPYWRWKIERIQKQDQRQLIHLVHVGVTHCPFHPWEGRWHEPVLDPPWDRAHSSVILSLTQAGHSGLEQPSHNEILTILRPKHHWIWSSLLVYDLTEFMLTPECLASIPQLGIGNKRIANWIGWFPLLRETFGSGRVSSRGRQKLYKEDVASGKILRELRMMFKYRPEESQVCQDIPCFNNPQSPVFYPSRWLGHHWTLGKQLGKPRLFF